MTTEQGLHSRMAKLSIYMVVRFQEAYIFKDAKYFFISPLVSLKSYSLTSFFLDNGMK